jgi:hypothetical protein
VSLNTALQAGSDLTSLQDVMLVLDSEIDSVNSKYTWNSEVPPGLVADFEESILARSLKAQAKIKLVRRKKKNPILTRVHYHCEIQANLWLFSHQNSARIKLHRYSAFLDAAIFTKKHCDLGEVSDNSSSFPISCCTMTEASSSTFDVQSFLLSTTIGNEERYCNFSSARVCMGAALAIGRAFESLPYPNPDLIQSGAQPSLFAHSPWMKPPRTMPIFACCAMQSSYVLLMLCDKIRELNGSPSGDIVATSRLGELSSGLQRVLEALQNYSIAFEAVGGMRGRS